MAIAEKQIFGIHLDVGHDSIGWCVTNVGSGPNGSLTLPGAGVVLFPADDCLANARRNFRRQRRHIRSTRQRIERIKQLLAECGALTREELDRNVVVAPWKLAAAALNGKKLNWLQLWAVLRWYAHNRGYDGNALASLKGGRVVDPEEEKKNEAARLLMLKHKTNSMAETMCKEMSVDYADRKASSQFYFKGLKVSFARNVVVDEVARILRAHMDCLPGLDEDMFHLLMADPIRDPHALRNAKKIPFHVQNRYWGGLLFGQLAPRFDNRIIGVCPVSGKKLPIKSTPEFLRFRFAMMLANVSVGESGRPLSAAERCAIRDAALISGGFTKGEFKKIVAATSGETISNVDALLATPDADVSLELLPGLMALSRCGIREKMLAQDVKVVANKLFKGKKFTIGKLLEMVPDAARGELGQKIIGKGKARSVKKIANPFERQVSANLPAGRAPYARNVMGKAVATVYSGEDPRVKGGVLYRDPTEDDALSESKLDSEVNNHLIRHRIKILLRLIKDIVRDYAENNPARVAQVTVEMARDIKDMSGKTNKDIVSEMLLKTAAHRKSAEELAKFLKCEPSAVSAGLIRKLRIAKEMGFTCPYTGWKYDMQDVISRHVDLDHILPRSQRATDSMDSLVLTFTEVNRMKGARTGVEFINEFGGMRVPGRDNLEVLTYKNYEGLVKGLKDPVYADDRKRQMRRKQNLLKPHSSDAGMTEGLLTRTSYITTLAQKAIRGYFSKCGRTPKIVSIPGRVTALLRRDWDVLGALAKIDPRIIGEDGNLRIKSEIRGITHMHHAVDAIVLGLAATLLPVDGTFWSVIAKRRVTASEADWLKYEVGCFDVSAGGEPHLKDLPRGIKDQILNALSEQRVVVHMPQERNGLLVDQLTWGVDKIEDGFVHVHQRSRDEKTGSISLKRDELPVSKAFGISPKDGEGKLKRIKGVLPINSNFGIALTDPPTVVRHAHVWRTIGGMEGVPVVRRNCLISVESGNYAGIWRVASVKDVARAGAMLDLVAPYAIKVANKVAYAKINVSLATLMKNGLRVLKPRYTGVPLCHTMLSTSRVKSASSQ